MTLRITGNIRNDLSAWIDVLAPSGMSGVSLDGSTTRDLIALLVACRATIGAEPVVIDLSPSDYSVGGAS